VNPGLRFRRSKPVAVVHHPTPAFQHKELDERNVLIRIAEAQVNGLGWLKVEKKGAARAAPFVLYVGDS
jgi:hypothetical protein